MKPYFAKYLPVEGEIKEGDIISLHIPEGENPFSWENGIYYQDTPRVLHGEGYVTIKPIDYCSEERVMRNGLAYKKEYMKGRLQLFLCSRDIQIGDKVKDEYSGLDITATKDNFPSNASDFWLKVIGPISTEAKWVKDGDEFDEDETSFDQKRSDLIESLRLDFESRTGLGLGNWVKDSEDGYKSRYQGTIYNYSENGGDLQIMYGSTGTWGGATWGYEEHTLPMTEEQILNKKGTEAPVKYRNDIIKIKGPCGHFH